ncbi:MAG: hypothetical protein Tsb009_17000 [Planctomycetaceae bacterium]
MKILQQSFEEEFVLLDLQAQDLGTIFHATMDFVCERGIVDEKHRETVESALLQREEEVSTAIGHAVAIPHAYLDILDKPVVVFIRLAHSLNLGAPDGIPTRFLFVLLGPTGVAARHLDTLTAIARIMSDDEFRYDARRARNGVELSAALARFLERTSAPPHEEEEQIPEGLQYTGKLFGGLRGDIRRRLPHYVSDFRDGIHPKSLAAICFLVFAFLAPAVTFGGIMNRMTDGQIGAVQMITATAVCGCVYALIAGQPLAILGGTGPLLIFTSIFYHLCKHQIGIEFLPAYAWTGLWTAGLLILLAATDACVLMRYFTRFTDEIFAALISIIFIIEAVNALARMFHNLDEASHHATALLTVLLALGTYYIAMSLSGFRRSRYLLQWMREFLADFGPTIALVCMSLVAIWLHEVDLEVIDVSTSDSDEPWLIDLWAAPVWVRFAAVVPALLAVMLIFINQNITGRLVNSRQHKLKKGEAYHLDLAIVGLLIGVCSLFGLPWVIATIVPSLNHVRSLATTEEVVVPGGETRERIIHVRETRVTGLAIHLLIGLMLFLLPYLKYVPMPVLYGLLLYMGVVSILGNQFFERLSLWIMDSQLYPATHYIRRVPKATIHKYTLLQLGCLALLWIIKSNNQIGIIFPLFVAFLVPIRLLANRYFDPEHLEALDAEEEPEEEETHWSV